MVDCIYGAKNVFIDVTDKVLNMFKKDSSLFFSRGWKYFNEYFSDPFAGELKFLIIVVGERIYNIPENDTGEHSIDLKITSKELITFIVPTIGRTSLMATLESIENQTNSD